MSLKKFFRKVTGTEPDYWDMQLVDLLKWRQFVLFDGINPEGEIVEVQVGAIRRSGRGIWFMDMDPWPDGKSADAVLLFVDRAFEWHKAVLPGVGQRYVLLGVPHFDVIEEGFIGGQGKQTRRILARFKAQRGTQRVLLIDMIPFTPEADELLKWYEAAKAKLDFEKIRKLPAKLIELTSEIERLKTENAALVQENQILRAQVAVLYGELNRIKAQFPGLVTDEAIRQIVTEINLQRLEEAEQRIYGRPSPWDLILRRKRETPSEKVREEVQRLEEEVKEVEEELKEVGEGE